MGDFNINLLKVDKHVPSSEFLECMYTMSYIPLISKPTRVTATSATLIDNIFTNNLTVNSTETCSGILYTDISDHFPVFYVDNNSCSTYVNTKYITKRFYTDQNIAKFTTSLTNADWSLVTSELDDPNNAYAAFYSQLGKHYLNCFPEVKIKQKYSNRKPWLSHGLKTSIKLTNK